MNCFFCDQAAKGEPAVGICIRCGKAVCRQHLVVQKLPVNRKFPAGTGFRIEVLSITQSRVLCLECAEVAAFQSDESS